jgi:hypothetical protein
MDTNSHSHGDSHSIVRVHRQTRARRRDACRRAACSLGAEIGYVALATALPSSLFDGRRRRIVARGRSRGEITSCSLRVKVDSNLARQCVLP